ncbi:hypothetical protein [Rhodococcus xishaensis]|uniref:Integral membrane protein n=1 Tax=Rhodococcus xishaensis TaxID=2487364 RepID=A0A3S3CPW1_9NOCA|nr:hypothetical protein [Rhodococcus xishaensis]RVW02822.1 hypothetical protein EGT50_08760 [Rhodococcus xishaensis]
MSVLYNIFVAVHLLGMAAIVGGYLSVLNAPRISEVMVWGARIQLLSGLVIVGMGESIASLDKDYDNAKIGVKLLIALAVVAVAEIGRARQKRGEGNPNLAHVVGGLAIVNTLIAVLWT